MKNKFLNLFSIKILYACHLYSIQKFSIFFFLYFQLLFTVYKTQLKRPQIYFKTNPQKIVSIKKNCQMYFLSKLLYVLKNIKLFLSIVSKFVLGLRYNIFFLIFLSFFKNYINFAFVKLESIKHFTLQRNRC